MTNDPRRFGGQEYGAQPSMRPAPQGYGEPQQVQVPYEQMAPRTAPAHTMPGAQGYGEVQVPYAAPAAAQPQVQSPPPAAKAKDPNTVTLSKAYMAHGEPVTEITLRRPLAREIAQCGNPVRFLTDPASRVTEFDMRWDVVIKYIPLLSTPPLPPSTVADFEFFDLDACAAVLAPFFVRFQT